MDTDTINYPAWTEYKKKNGLDPLGMQNSSVNLYQTLLPGISNVTLRIRYYGLYAWLCRTYAQRIRNTNPERWKQYLRRAEALYALCAFHHGGQTGVAGIDWAQKAYAAAGGGSIEFGQAAEPGSENHYLKQAWGAYGAAYRSQLFEIGIFTSSPDHEIPLPSAELGERLAVAFEEALGDLPALFHDVIERGAVTMAALGRLGPLAPSEIDLTSAERALYQEILLQQTSPDDAAGTSRRLSMVLILRIAELLGRDPKPEEVRWILYAGLDQVGRELELGSLALKAQRARWWVYHANDLCHIALETLLKLTLDTLGTFTGGTTLSRLIPLCVDQFLETAPLAPADWPAFLDLLQPAQNPYGLEEPDGEWFLATEIMKHAGREDESVCPPEIAWKALALLAILHKRVRDEGHDIAAELAGFNPEAFRSLLTETRFLDQRLKEDFRDSVARILEERVVRRHLWVALRKFRHQNDYTFLIESDEGRLRLREKDGPVFTNPRLGPAITFLKDIHLIGGQGLTDEGVQVARNA